MIALPNDASVEAVGNEVAADADTERGTKTRRIECPTGHDVYVTFRVSIPEDSGSERDSLSLRPAAPDESYE